MALSPGTRLGPYETVGPLGSGGMGEVYRARDPRLGREVAIKVLSEHLTNNPQALSRFKQEARAVAALSHPNILAIYDIGTDQGVSFAVMELLEGESLRSRLKSASLAWSNAVEIAAAIAEGLAAAHAKGITHRDLKPENIFLTSDGRVKILDFGLARWNADVSPQEQTSAPTETEEGRMMGTVGYMPPEQVRGERADHRSDVFSLGCVLYEMVAGKRAFRGRTPADTLVAVLSSDPPDLAQSGPDIPPGVERVIRRCLKKNPDERFQSAQDVGAALVA